MRLNFFVNKHNAFGLVKTMLQEGKDPHSDNDFEDDLEHGAEQFTVSADVISACLCFLQERQLTLFKICRNEHNLAPVVAFEPNANVSPIEYISVFWEFNGVESLIDLAIVGEARKRGMEIG